MSRNKDTVREFMAAFSVTDRARILACLTDDVEWVLPGTFRARGKKEFDAQIDNDGFEGTPEITVARMTEENDVVIAEGAVRTKRKGGPVVTVLFCDVFEMRNALIHRLTSYLAEAGG